MSNDKKAALLRSICATMILWALESPLACAGTTVEVPDFGSNPGNLRLFKYIPDHLPQSAALVVALHGCTQGAHIFAAESGWIQLAEKLRFALALPEQKQENNLISCFNWFEPNDITRDQGEALSIKQMVDKIKLDHNIDDERVYVTGLSAGGAMTSVMLATYPDVFAGGGIVAGIPYGCAKNRTDAQLCMTFGHRLVSPLAEPPNVSAPAPSGSPMVSVPGLCQFLPQYCPSSADQRFTPSQWGDLVRQASNYRGPFPKVSIWHGTADTTVNFVNASDSMEQWTDVHGTTLAVRDTVKGYPHQRFNDASGNAVVETYTISGMRHGEPVDPGTSEGQCGTIGHFAIDADICASYLIARFWGLVHEP